MIADRSQMSWYRQTYAASATRQSIRLATQKSVGSHTDKKEEYLLLCRLRRGLDGVIAAAVDRSAAVGISATTESLAAVCLTRAVVLDL